MTDPSNDVAYYDPLSSDFPLEEDLLCLSDPPNPNLSDISLLPDSDSNPYLNHQPKDKDEIAETSIDPFKDYFIWGQYDNFNGDNNNNPQPTSSEIHGEKDETPQPKIPCFENSVSLPAWPVRPVAFSCSCCQILREIIHTNGMFMLYQDIVIIILCKRIIDLYSMLGSFTTKLEVHGRPGLIFHAVLENRYTAVDGIPPGHQMIE